MKRSDLSQLSETQQRALLAELLSERLSSESSFPMSVGQQGMWHDYRRNPQATHFNVFLPVRIRGSLDVATLQQALSILVLRHESLRTTFSDDSEGLVQTVHADLPPEFSCHCAQDASDDSLRSRLYEQVQQPFDLERGPLLRIHIFKKAPEDWILLAMTHHIVVDFWSLVLILNEVNELYSSVAGQRSSNLLLPPAKCQPGSYRTFVDEQSRLLSGQEGRRLADYWKSVVHNTPQILNLPIDFVRPPVFTHRADCIEIPISKQLSDNVLDQAKKSRTTPFAVLHAALQVFLSRLSGQDSFFIGSPFAGRSHRRFEETIGFFINMLPVLSMVKRESCFEASIAQTSARLMETLEHEQFPIAEIVRTGEIPRDPSRSPLFQVSCTLEKSHRRQWLGSGGFLLPCERSSFEFAGMKQESFYVPHPTCHYDLELVFDASEHTLGGMMIYCRDLFKRQTVQLFAQQYAELLECLLRQPNRPISEVFRCPELSGSTVTCPFFADNKASSNTSSANNISDPESVASQTVHDRILRSATVHHGRLALQSNQDSVTYEQMVNAASLLSHRLQQSGIQANDLVPVLAQPGAKAFTGFLAVHLSGAAVVPLDPKYHSEQLAQIFAQVNPKAVLLDSFAKNPMDVVDVPFLEIEFPVSGPPAASSVEACQEPIVGLASRRSGPQDLAYLVYTSGSTGVPKGVLVEHGSIFNTLRWRARRLPLSADDRILMLFSHQFDAGLGIGWSALQQGAALIWADDQSHWDISVLLQQLLRDRITVLPVLPSMLRLLVRHPLFERCETLREIWVGGEPLPEDLPAEVREKLPVRIWNLYGPTEASVEATAKEVTHHSPNEIMTIGWPIDEMSVSILDSDLSPLPPGVTGQIAISGPGLARGYLDDEPLTRKKFVCDPKNSGRRLYLTGDLGRMLPDGQIVFLGREDRQVKVSGYRIELEEIEATLESHPQIDRAAVLAESVGSASTQLKALVSATVGSRIDRNEIRAFLKQHLPYYKIPSSLIPIDHMPLTASGKIDRNRLISFTNGSDLNSTITPPTNPLESLIAHVWAQELEVERISIHDNFFDSGGNSLQAAIVTNQLNEKLGVHVPTALLFDMLTIAQIAARLAQLYPEKIAERFSIELRDHCKADFITNGESTVHPLLAPLKPTGNKTPCFLVHPPGGIVVCYRQLAELLSEDQPLWAIRSRGLHGKEALPETLSEMAADYVEAIRSVQPHGPYVLGGWSLGGLVAYEMAAQLIDSGETVERLILLDSAIPEGVAQSIPAEEQVNAGLEYGIDLTLDQLSDLPSDQQLGLLYEHAKQLGILEDNSPPEVVSRVMSDLQALFHHHLRLAGQHRLQPLKVRLLLVRPEEVPSDVTIAPDRGWRHLVDEVRVAFVPGHHHSMLQSPHVERLAEIMAKELI